VLLQKTMVTVEGVARRIDPDHDIWAASEPVVRRWIARELSPTAQVRSFAAEARGALSALSALAAERTAPPAAPPQRQGLDAWVGFALGAAFAGLAFALAVWFR
jgi:ubiquinone biosynthesis protein